MLAITHIMHTCTHTHTHDRQCEKDRGADNVSFFRIHTKFQTTTERQVGTIQGSQGLFTKGLDFVKSLVRISFSIWFCVCHANLDNVLDAPERSVKDLL